MKEFEIIINGDRAKVITPYNLAFVGKIKSAGGRWDAGDKCWTVPAFAVDTVRELMREVYGRDDQDAGSVVDVRLTFGGRVEKTTAAVTIFGKVVATAWGRDSGAKPGPDACFAAGAPESGGSVRNWTTEIPKGCVVILHNVQLGMVNADTLPNGVAFEILGGDDAKRSALLEEKERLLARIAEIEAELNAEPA